MPTLKLFDTLTALPLFKGMGHDELSRLAGRTKFDFIKLQAGRMAVCCGQPTGRLLMLAGGPAAGKDLLCRRRLLHNRRDRRALYHRARTPLRPPPGAGEHVHGPGRLQPHSHQQSRGGTPLRRVHSLQAQPAQPAGHRGAEAHRKAMARPALRPAPPHSQLRVSALPYAQGAQAGKHTHGTPGGRGERQPPRRVPRTQVHARRGPNRAGARADNHPRHRAAHRRAEVARHRQPAGNLPGHGGSRRKSTATSHAYIAPPTRGFFRAHPPLPWPPT